MDERIFNAEAIVFDVGNVLLDFNPHAACALLPPEKSGLLYPVLFGEVHLWAGFDLGAESNETVARRAAQAAGIPQAWEDVLYILHHFHETMPALPLYHLIPQIKALGKRLYALTNYPEPSFSLACQAFPHLQMLDGALVSSREKMVKPHPEIFQLLKERFQLTPEKTLFIDDLSANVQAAAAAGFQIWHYAGENRIF